MGDRLNKKLIELRDTGLYPFHMPGHKRNIKENYSFGGVLKNMYEADITEIDGFDNLHDAKDLIKDAEERASILYKSDETHFLVNGSTCGILSAISSVCNRGDKIIVARNCHVSVYNAIFLNDLRPVYVYPDVVEENGLKLLSGISKESIEKAIIDNEDAVAVIITSPTYDGILSDVAAIAKICHEYDKPLIVDEAHGALFFMEGRSAVINKADIVINSVHKTLPALTQTALLHINGNLVDRSKVRKYLRIYQTSSPSYILMGSIDYTMEVMEEEGKSLYRNFCIRTVKIKEELNKLKNLRLVTKDSLIKKGVFDFDESKVLITTANTGVTGKELYNILVEKYSLQPEMAAGDYVLLMTTIYDSDEGIDRLIRAIKDIDENIGSKTLDYIKEKDEFDVIELEEFIVGQSSLYTVFAYPPGIPILVKDEMVTEEAKEEIKKAVNSKLDIKLLD
ncbi:MAG: aminotransferase class I/II-fold pyridoxal phosphate-dependent enzyme [Lachnospiraceae bacterium]|nr:aminotransferase class I/II-fold pyridoxal phosphate-dependent enzyme [Lachnospiraceae bacterium]